MGKEQKQAPALNPNMLFREFINQVFWPLHVESGNLKPSTVTFYRNMLPRCNEFFGSKKLSSIGKADVEQFIAWLRRQQQANGNALSASTVKHHFNFLRICLTFAENHELIAKNPTRGVSAPKLPHKNVDYLSPADANAFLSAIARQPTRWQAIMLILLYLGLRRGEVCGLQWQDVDFEHCTLSIRRNVTYTPKKGIYVGEPKTENGIRTLPMPKPVAAILHQWHKEQVNLYGVERMPDNAFVFSSNTDAYTPQFPTNITSKVKRFMKQNGLPDCSPHDLRHTCGSLMLESGASVKMVQMFLGHEDPETTLRFYAGTNAESLRAASNVLSATLETGKISKDVLSAECAS
ncbi:MAG: tyrosine-type recombinase/integrase [Subdoligranulum sp.]|nr:tyrosine-type recombinase/integrase [Subdoligranulum sp.]